MADDRSAPGAAADEVHDDDELAEVLAAELERYATGAVPVLPRPAPPVVPGAAIHVEPPTTAPMPQLRAAPVQPPSAPRPTSGPRPAPASAAPSVPRPPERDGPDVGFRRRVAEVEQAVGGEALSFRRSPSGAMPDGRRAARVRDLPTVTDEQPVRRRSGFRAPPPETPGPDPLDRVMPTGPISLPEPTAALLDGMIGGRQEHPSARHAAPPAEIEEPPDGTPGEQLAGTGPLAVPHGLYEDWEHSLRAIGRPRSPWDEDDQVVGGAPVDAPTVAVAVRPPDARTPRHDPPASVDRAVVTSPAALDAGADRTEEAGDGSRPEVARRRVRGDRRRALPRADEVEPPPLDQEAVDAEEIDEIAAPHAQVSAATTGAIELPSVEPGPRTGPVLMERVRTAILQLPAGSSPSGSGAAAVVGRWVGGFASPLALLLGFGLAEAGAGPASLVALAVGVLVAVPAIVRSATWAAAVDDDGAMLESVTLGRVAGTVAAAVLVLARLAAAAATVFAVASLFSSWAGRTGAFGGSVSGTAIVGAVAAGVVATAVAVLPARIGGVLVLVLGAVGLVGTLLLALVLAPAGSGTASATPGGSVAAAVAGFVGVGLVLALCAPDVVRWRTGSAIPRSSAVAAALAAVAGTAVVAVALVVAAGAAAGEGAADGLAGALTDATAAVLAAPLGGLLLIASITLPVLLLRSAGAAAARLVDRGRSARLATVAAGLIALAAGLGLVAAAPDADAVLVAAAALAGVPVAAWAGVLVLAPLDGRPRGRAAAVVLVAATLLGWLLSDGLVPGLRSLPLDLLGLSGPVRGGPVVGLVAAVLVGVVGGLVARTSQPGRGPARLRTAEALPAVDGLDTVEG